MQNNNHASELVSVVIPCFNSGSTISQTVTSVHFQTWPNVEIIVIDDGSTDQETIKVLEALKGVYLVRQHNAGLPVARNVGCKVASGNYILPLDADDWLEPAAIKRLMECLRENPAASFAYSYLQLEGEATGVLAKSYNFFEQLFFNQLPYCLLLPRSVWESVGGYDESMDRGYEDWEFNIRLGAAGYFGCVVQEPLFHYRVSSGGMLLSKSNRLHGALWAEIQGKHINIFNLRRLIILWREWRSRPSTYPLLIYFVWFACHRLLPDSIFSILFRWVRRYSHSQRITARDSGI